MTCAAGPDSRPADPDLVSVVIPTHGRPELLAQTLHSVVRQRGVDLEVLVVDDETDRRTREVVRGMGADHVRVIENRRGSGAASSRNVGLTAATGRWVAFCDDDDLWAPDKISAQLDAIRRRDDVWSCTGAATVGPDLSLIGHERLDPSEDRALRDWNLIPGGGSSVLAATDAVRSAGGFDESLSNMEDWELWIRLGDLGPVASVDRPLVAYRLWPGSKSSMVCGMRSSARRILGRHAQWPPPPEVAYQLEWYVAWKLTVAGRGREAAGISAQLARHHRSVKCALRAVALLANVELVRSLDRRKRAAAIPACWRADIDTWLPELRSSLGAT